MSKKTGNYCRLLLYSTLELISLAALIQAWFIGHLVLILLTSTSLFCTLIEHAAELHGLADNGPSTGLMSKVHRCRTYRVVFICLALLVVLWVAGSIISILGVEKPYTRFNNHFIYPGVYRALGISFPITSLVGAVVTTMLAGITLGQGLSVGLDEPIHRRGGITLSDESTA